MAARPAPVTAAHHTAEPARPDTATVRAAATSIDTGAAGGAGGAEAAAGAATRDTATAGALVLDASARGPARPGSGSANMGTRSAAADAGRTAAALIAAATAARVADRRDRATARSSAAAPSCSARFAAGARRATRPAARPPARQGRRGGAMTPPEWRAVRLGMGSISFWVVVVAQGASGRAQVFDVGVIVALRAGVHTSPFFFSLHPPHSLLVQSSFLPPAHSPLSLLLHFPLCVSPCTHSPPRTKRPSSPLSTSSATMSAPPTNSPRTNTCGMVGQAE